MESKLTAAHSSNLSSARVLETCLIVDDDPFDRGQIKQAVTRHRPDLQTFEFGTLTEARSYLNTANADIILLDNQLPDGRGAALASELRADPRHEDTPIIVITSDDVHTLDHAITALSKDDINAQTIGELLSDFLKIRRIARGDSSEKMIKEFGMEVSNNLSPVFSRAIRTLRMAKSQVSRTAPLTAIQALDQVEDILMALSRVVDDNSKQKH